MKIACQILFFLLYTSSTYAQQVYVRGVVKDEAGNLLQNVTIRQHKTGYISKNGSEGTFGIAINQPVDTFSFSLDGYLLEKVLVGGDKYVNVKLKKLSASATSARRDKLSSFTKNLEKDEQKNWFTGEETYASILENHFVNTKRFPTTGMSLNVDRASYSNIRRFLTQNALVPPDAVRIEEMLNYFNLNYQEPDKKDLFAIKTTLSTCPWNTDNQLFYINLFSKKLDLDTLPPSNLVFLIDVSGSMDMPNRLPLLQSAFRLLVNNLREKDSVSVVVYGGVTGIMLNATSGAEKDKIKKAIDELTPGGSTPGESGIKIAYSVAKNHFIKGGNNRVILATDGDFNVGLKTETELDDMISMQRESGIYLTCLGVGMGNYKDSKIQMLAKKGNGNFAYLDNFKEAEKVLLKEFTQTLYAVADDVYMNVDFNANYVKEYRLVGFDNKVGALKDSTSVLEGGEIGSAYSMMALFEIVPTDANKFAIKDNQSSGNFANINLQYNLPNKKEEFHYTSPCPFDYTPANELEKCYRFSSAVALFGSILRSSAFIKNTNWADLLLLAEGASSNDDQLQREFIALVQQAKLLYTKNKKKKNDRQEK